MKTFRVISNLVLLIAAVFLGYSYVNKIGIFNRVQGVSDKASLVSPVSEEDVISAAFSNLINQEGKVVSSGDFLGKHMLVIFGFSHCRHICPAELGMASQLLNRLGKDADRLRVVFITVDPKNDTVERLSEYHKAFDERIQMLTGDESEISKVVKGYKVYVGSEGGENGDIDHSSLMYLIDENGKYVAHFSPDLGSPEGSDDELFDTVTRYLLKN